MVTICWLAVATYTVIIYNRDTGLFSSEVYSHSKHLVPLKTNSIVKDVKTGAHSARSGAGWECDCACFSREVLVSWVERTHKTEVRLVHYHISIPSSCECFLCVQIEHHMSLIPRPANDGLGMRLYHTTYTYQWQHFHLL